MIRDSKVTSLFLVAGFAGLLVLLSYAIWPGTTLQTLRSPDETHVAKLSRLDWIDRNYIVTVDGWKVFRSPDFAPSDRVPFRETLFWDATGKVVVFEVARHRIFGYDVSRRQALTDEELLAVEAPPDPPLWEYSFESEWPGIGRVRRGEM